ncbi:MAG: nicotinate-nucleotide--dimethylbenzimidazole phosphoribosyltransferase [Planctomycetes bacterium]|nr:nicotinate-nucleotide--dimethylbenzimidazole phosphoribosyltransferase [Planctomycetota bacterium]
MGLLDETLGSIAPADDTTRQQARSRLDQLTMPHRALGHVMDLAEDLAAMTGSMNPPVKRRAIAVMASDHGVCDEGISKFPQEVTVQMVHNFLAGGAGINALAHAAGADVHVVDMGVAADLSELIQEGQLIDCKIGPGTANIAKGPAMSGDEAVRSVEAGISVARQLIDSNDILAAGDMGIGNTTPSAAVGCAITGDHPAEMTGRGTGIDDDGLEKKIAVVQKSLEVNEPDADDGLDVLAKVGGFEIGGIAGFFLGCAAACKPVLVDGLICTAGALIAHAICLDSVDYMIAAHRSVERGHILMLKHLGKHPLLDLQLRLGEGTGAALAIPLLEAASRVLTEVSTFEEASVSQSEQ